MLQEPMAFGIPRTERCMFITFYFNNRDAKVKADLFRAVVDHLGTEAGVRPEDVLMAVVETGRDNWWAAGRVVNPDTGYDERMSADAVGGKS